MGNSVHARRLIALAAAYVIALQAALLPLSVAAGSPFTASLCAAASSADGSSAPAGHDSGCPCAAGCGMQCCAQMLAAPQHGAIALRSTSARAMTAAVPIRPVIRPADRSPQVPRAPPVT
jgi:hypothetical protein